MSDQYNDPKFRAWAAKVKRELIPRIKGSHVFASIVCDPENIDAKFSVELGIAVMLDKPIIAIVRPGTRIPEKLARVVDRFVEWNGDDHAVVSQAIEEILVELGFSR